MRAFWVLGCAHVLILNFKSRHFAISCGLHAAIGVLYTSTQQICNFVESSHHSEPFYFVDFCFNALSLTRIYPNRAWPYSIVKVLFELFLVGNVLYIFFCFNLHIY